MAGNALRTVIVGALIMIGWCAQAFAAPIAPQLMIATLSAPVDPVSFWGIPFPFGYAYRPGQCYKYVPEETPNGVVWKRVWICVEKGGLGYGEGGRF